VPNATLRFLPWVRQGAAAAIVTVDSLGPGQPAVAEVAAALTLNDAPVPGVTVRLRGPADVVGIDPNQVVRTDPRPGTVDFEPNCFPAVEFDRPDFPWLFTPARATTAGRLRPWLCLVVVRRQSGVTVATTPDAPLPTLRIADPAVPAVELPDPTESWAWAHAQVAADDGGQPQIAAALVGRPELSLSRLVCPRILDPETDYVACVVPTFELGRRAGLGQPVADADLTAAGALAPAWALTSPPAEVRLPVLYHWEFRTGQRGDFESLARRLAPAAALGLGTRPVDVSRPGFPAGGATTVDLEGALLPIPPAGSPPPTPEPLPEPFQATLAGIVNEPSRVEAADPDADPLLAPPLYGRWHAGRASVAPDGPTWLDQLNLDPRWRVVAGFGTRVVQQHQEALMASAWGQAAELEAANQRLRQLQLSMAVGERLHERHLAALDEEMVLRVAAPAFGRLQQEPGRSLLAAQERSPLPVAATRSAMRRIGRQRGPLTRRLTARGFTRSATDTWVVRLNTVGGLALPAVAPPSDFSPIPVLPTERLAGDSWFGAFPVAPEGAPVAMPGEPVLVRQRTEVPGFFRAAAIDHLARALAPHLPPPGEPVAAFTDVKPLVVAQTHPRVALPPLVAAIVSLGDNLLTSTAPGVAPVGVETVMVAPSFPQPMYEALRELSQELLLPGLDRVEPDTVLGLRTNRRFVEAYLVGLNHELGRELLWRGFPTDQRGTWFRHFWGLGVPNAAPPDIEDLTTWDGRALGDPGGAPVAEEFVMLLRSGLLRRYPNAVIYLTPAVRAGGPPDPQAVVPDEDPAHELAPVFGGSLPPDVSFFGFAVSTQAATGADGGLGHYLVIQEHPTEPRFGLDVGASPGQAGHLGIAAGPPAGVPLDGHTWGRNAAEMAAITRRLPVRVAIHASRLVAPG
jgi:hypothetical protein